MAKAKGSTKIAGRAKGTPNKLTQTVKDVFTNVFTELQEHPEVKLLEWAKLNPTDFYKLSAKLIPTAVNAEVTIKKLGADLEDEIYED